MALADALPDNLGLWTVSFALITAGVIFFSPDKRKRLKQLFSQKLFLISLALIFGWSYLTVNLPDDTEQHKKMREATKQAILGLIIAIMSYLELVIAPFWILWLVSYYLGMGA